ncbi:hypothetical protein [Cupriavidus metallidurans]|uniref:hypothetical protein n=1 Tax=Cupriavidus metallidurans TaxID=119219 RepID=UPI00055A30D7|nr:hypothetical protein [Cupriavidus metallidurans]
MTEQPILPGAQRELQISNAVDVTLSQIRMLLAMLKHLHSIAPAGTDLQTDIFVVIAHTLDVHSWLANQWAEANGPTPGASAQLLSELAAGIAAATGEANADGTEPGQDGQTVH